MAQSSFNKSTQQRAKPLLTEARLEEQSRLRHVLKQAVAQACHLPSVIIPEEFNDQQLLQQELSAARALNFELPDNLESAITQLESVVNDLTHTRQCLLLVLDEEKGTYTCLNDEKQSLQKPRELCQISDDEIRGLLHVPGYQEILHTYLFAEERLVGIVAITQRVDGQSFTLWDQVQLEVMAQYLATKLLAVHHLKENQNLAVIQRVILETSAKLITAVDQEGVLMCTLETLSRQLGFGLAQYIQLNPKSGKGEILMEYQHGETRSYIHAGLESQRKPVNHYRSMIGLFQSSARHNPYLLIPGNALGDKPIKTMFHLKPFDYLPSNKRLATLADTTATQIAAVLSDEIYATVVMPVIDPVSGDIRGTLNFYQTTDQHLGAEVFDITREMVSLISLTLSRVMVLEKAMELASTDELTGLSNRRAFYERFEAEIERARRNQTHLCVALIDVDHFKNLNDTYGHLNGDVVLRSLAQTFKTSFRKSDVVCRFGGEEFAILLPDTRFEDARELMERIRQGIEELTMSSLENEVLQTTCSFGLTQVATTQHLGDPISDIISASLAEADEYLYLAKDNGRNRVEGQPAHS